MIKTLQLQNFQVHRDFQLDLDPNITVIRGRTDSGKSSVLRALRWISLNNLAGESFIRRGAKFSRVSLRLQTTDGRDVEIVRQRGKANIYKLDGRVFKAFGSKVPDPIAAALDVNEINFQKQHDSPFWFAASAPEVSRQLNRVIDLSVIDSSLSKAAAVVRTARERISVAEERLTEKRERYELLNKIGTQRVETFKLLQSEYEQLTDSVAACDRLAGVVQEFTQYPIKILEQRVSATGLLLAEAEKLLQVFSRAGTLRQIISVLGAVERQARELPDFSRLESAWRYYAQVEDQTTGLDLLVRRAEKNEQAVEYYERISVELEATLAKEKCPLCGRKNQ